MDVPADTIRKIIEEVDCLCEMIETFGLSEIRDHMTEREKHALKMLPGFMDELQRCLDANPPWRR